MGVGVVIVETKANLAQFQMKFPAGAKLGNIRGSSLDDKKKLLIN